MLKYFVSAGAAALTSLVMNGAEPLTLKVHSGVSDTMYTARAEMICVTTPGAKATVNGHEAHVYSTGSFQATLDLQPGDNKVSIVVRDASGEVRKDLNIFRAERRATATQPRPAHDPEATVMFATPVYVKSLKGAYMQYGNGDDRLGGSKMGFIDADIPLTVIGEKGSLYCVRLAADRIAYIPKEYTMCAAPATGVVNTATWDIADTGKADKVTISLPRRLPYQYMTSIEPNALTVDIFGATDNSNWITQRTLELGIIDHYDFRQIGEDVYRVVLYLKGGLQWGFGVAYEGDNLVITVRHQPASLKLKDLVIGLDAGHGGEFPGAISPSGIKEKDVNLDIIRRVDALLRREGARTVLTRDGDTGPSMTERKRIWADAMVDLAVSVHNNAAGSPSVDGTAILYKHTFCRPMALCMTKRMMETGLNLFGIVQNFNFSLNGPTLYPEVLVEGMFMSNPADEERLGDPKFRQLVAEKIVAAIKDYLKQAETSR